MEEAFVHPDTHVVIHDVDIPTPSRDQILIKVVVSGSNPKDHKRPMWFDKAHNSGDDIAGIVTAVGSEVRSFRPGDRVAALHELMAPHGSYAEFGIAYEFATFHIPATMGFEEAATVPLAAMTAALGLFQRMDLPAPWRPATNRIPLIIYGGAGAVGSFAIKLAQAANIHPLIVVAGNSMDYVKTLTSPEKGDAIVDYRQSDEDFVVAVQEAIKDAGETEVKYAYDAVTGHDSWLRLSKVLANPSQLTLVLPGLDFSGIPSYISYEQSAVSTIFGENLSDEEEKRRNVDADFGALWFKWFERALADGRLTPHPHEVIEGGLNGVEVGLKGLKEGKNKATKYVFKIGDA